MSRWQDSLRDWAADLAVATAGGVFLGVIGPFGSYLNGPAWQRVVFQVGCFWAGILMFGTLIRVLTRLRLRPLAFWALLLGGVAAIDAPFSWVVSRFARLLWPYLTRLPPPLEWYLQALITSIPVVVGFVFLIRHRERRRRLAREAGAAPPSADGLLGAPASQVLCLQMEDHYVRVHTAGGSRLALATLSQAIGAMGRTEGLQTHRSWWVARRAIAAVVADGRNLRLELVNGITAPVARSAVAAVRAAGWIDGEA